MNFNFNDQCSMDSEYLNKFFNSNIIISNSKKLKEYINFCLTNKTPNKVRFKTELHHILPKSLFPEYSNLKEHPWNGVHLLHKNHYIAHSILAQSIDHKSVIFAWNAMTNQNNKAYKKVIPLKLIEAKTYAELKEKTNKKLSELAKQRTVSEDTRLKISKSQKGKKLSKEHIEKLRAVNTNPKSKEAKLSMSKAANKILPNGLTVAQKRNRKLSLKRHETIIVNNKKTTLHKIYGERSSKTKNSKEWKETVGKKAILKLKETITSREWKERVGKEAVRKTKETKKLKGRHFNLYHITKGLILKNIPYIEVKKIHQKIENTSFKKPIGYSKSSRIRLNKTYKNVFVGLYVKEIL